jgi:hypothetical protein
VPACSVSTVGSSRRLLERRRLFGYDAHPGTLTQRSFFLPDVADVNGVVLSLTVYAGNFSREGGGRRTELIGEPVTVYQAG